MAGTAPFRWTARRRLAAVMLGSGDTAKGAAAVLRVDRKTVERWGSRPEFAAEVERHAVAFDLARRAARVRMAKRIVARLGDTTNKDLLDWLKYIASETDRAENLTPKKAR